MEEEKMKKIETSAAPAAIGPYSQGIKIFCRRTCFHASAVFYTQGYALPFQAF